jgi:hypothetical protein
MNFIEKKLYELVNRIDEDDVVKNKKTGNVYTVKNFNPELHDKPTPAEVDLAKQKHGGKLPSEKDQKQVSPKTTTPKSKETPKPQPTDFKSSAEKRDSGEDPMSNTGKVASDTKLKSLMPGMDTSTKPLSSVSPIERQKISMKTDELARLGAEAKAKGEKAPNYNLCQVTIPGTNLYCEGNKGIPRDQMPQFKGTPEPGSPADKLPRDKAGEVDTEGFFREMLDKEGIKVSEPTPVPPDRLKATQSELVGVKVAGMAQVLEDPNHPAYEAITAPIYVSNDGYVVDGHHRWAAIVAHNAKHPDKPLPMNVRVIDERIDTLIPRSNKFAEDMGIRPKAADTGAAGGPQPISR